MEQYRQEQAARRFAAASRPFRPPTIAGRANSPQYQYQYQAPAQRSSSGNSNTFGGQVIDLTGDDSGMSMNGSMRTTPDPNMPTGMYATPSPLGSREVSPITGGAPPPLGARQTYGGGAGAGSSRPPGSAGSSSGGSYRSGSLGPARPSPPPRPVSQQQQQQSAGTGPRPVAIQPRDKHAKTTLVKVVDDVPQAPAPVPRAQQTTASSQHPHFDALSKGVLSHLPSGVAQPLQQFGYQAIDAVEQRLWQERSGWKNGSQPRPPYQAPWKNGGGRPQGNGAGGAPARPQNNGQYRPPGSSPSKSSYHDPYPASYHSPTKNRPQGLGRPAKYVEGDPLADEPEPSGYGGRVISASERDKQLQDMISNMIDVSEIDPTKAKVDGLTCELMPHQIQGVDWMVQREKGREKGGILADDMGLGKTVQTLALIVANRPSREDATIGFIEQPKPAQPAASRKKAAATAEKDKEEAEQPPKRTPIELKSKTTLILAPLAVIRQWEREINEKSDCGLKVFVHHANGRAKSAAELQKYDVVITTYTTASAEWGNTLEGKLAGSAKSKKGKGKAKKAESSAGDDDDDDEGKGASVAVSDEDDDDDDSDSFDVKAPGRKNKPAVKKGPPTPLFDSFWLRVVLDEAQNIKNHRAKCSMASFALGRRAHSKWCLSGTPIQNDSYELFSLIHFLGIPPFNEYKHFKDKIGEPLKSTNQTRVNWGLKRLRIVLGAIMLRRTKDAEHDGKKILQLPPRTVQVVETDFEDPAERQFYSALEGRMREELEKNLNSKEGKVNQLGALVMLLRLRQACSHPALTLKNRAIDAAPAAVPQTQAKTEPKNTGDDDDADDLLAAFDALRVTKTCDICNRALESTESVRCPDCEVHVRKLKEGDDWLQPLKQSTKVNILLDRLRQIAKEAPTEKSIVFSQFTSFLDLVEPFLKKDKVNYVRCE